MPANDHFRCVQAFHKQLCIRQKQIRDCKLSYLSVMVSIKGRRWGGDRLQRNYLALLQRQYLQIRTIESTSWLELDISWAPTLSSPSDETTPRESSPKLFFFKKQTPTFCSMFHIFTETQQRICNVNPLLP